MPCLIALILLALVVGGVLSATGVLTAIIGLFVTSFALVLGAFVLAIIVILVYLAFEAKEIAVRLTMIVLALVIGVIWFLFAKFGFSIFTSGVVEAIKR